MKKISIIASSIILLFTLSACGGTSPQVKKMLKDNKISEVSICIAQGDTFAKKRGKCSLVTSKGTVTIETAQKYIEQKKRKEAEKNARIEGKRKAKLEVARKATLEAERKAHLTTKEIQNRIKKLKLSEKEIQRIAKLKNNYVFGIFAPAFNSVQNKPLTHRDIDNYLYNKKAKIKVGKQYICSDGYDRWILKFNGKRITYGGVHRYMNILGLYQQSNQDLNYIGIDRIRGVLSYGGNILTCTPR